MSRVNMEALTGSTTRAFIAGAPSGGGGVYIIYSFYWGGGKISFHQEEELWGRQASLEASTLDDRGGR